MQVCLWQWRHPGAPAHFTGTQLARDDLEENVPYTEVTSTLWCTLLERSPWWSARDPRGPPRGRQ
jgi:hypothetical protein